MISYDNPKGISVVTDSPQRHGDTENAQKFGKLA